MAKLERQLNWNNAQFIWIGRVVKMVKLAFINELRKLQYVAGLA